MINPELLHPNKKNKCPDYKTFSNQLNKTLIVSHILNIDSKRTAPSNLLPQLSTDSNSIAIVFPSRRPASPPTLLPLGTSHEVSLIPLLLSWDEKLVRYWRISTTNSSLPDTLTSESIIVWIWKLKFESSVAISLPANVLVRWRPKNNKAPHSQSCRSGLVLGDYGRFGFAWVNFVDSWAWTIFGESNKYGRRLVRVIRTGQDASRDREGMPRCLQEEG